MVIRDGNNHNAWVTNRLCMNNTVQCIGKIIIVIQCCHLVTGILGQPIIYLRLLFLSFWCKFNTVIMSRWIYIYDRLPCSILCDILLVYFIIEAIFFLSFLFCQLYQLIKRRAVSPWSNDLAKLILYTCEREQCQV